jgi:hypothetical protein
VKTVSFRRRVFLGGSAVGYVLGAAELASAIDGSNIVVPLAISVVVFLSLALERVAIAVTGIEPDTTEKQ